MMHDLHYAARNLWRNRGFASSAILILAIGIAASTGLFAVIDAVVLHPLPYAGADRIVRVRLVPSSGRPRPAMVNADEFRAVERASTLDGAYIRESFTKTLAGTSFPESVWTEYYTGNAPTMLGFQPVAGRIFTEAEAPIGPDPRRVAMLTYDFWQRRFGGQRNAIGQTLRLDGESFTVIGVLPREYAMDLTDIAHRTREFGIRIALGAAPVSVLGSALRSTIIAAMAGLGIGLFLSVVLNSLLSQWSIRNMDDPFVLAAVAGTLLISTLAATLIPARRATTIQPTVALRAE
jgi:hypothetical protein